MRMRGDFYCNSPFQAALYFIGLTEEQKNEVKLLCHGTKTREWEANGEWTIVFEVNSVVEAEAVTSEIFPFLEGF